MKFRYLLTLAVVLAACTDDAGESTTTEPPTTVSESSPTTAPEESDPTIAFAGADEAARALVTDIGAGVDLDAVKALAASGDPRYAWLLSDFLRFLGPGDNEDAIVSAIEQLTDFKQPADRSPWGASTDFLIAADIEAPPDFREIKGELFSFVEPRWEPFFTDPDSLVDFRWLNWGGVRPDDRPLGAFEVPCLGGCIPALDDPGVTDAAGGDWYADDKIIFGLTVNGKSRAYPKNIMEIHEMVIDTLGGVRFGMPYCTLCGSAQAFDLDSVPDGVERPLLRTSGLLSRSNKVMYDLNTFSIFDTFTGEALSGPLREAEVELEMLSVVVSTWGDWKAAHPDTTIVAEDGGIGRRYAEDPLRGRDDLGPIFPIGDVDERLPVQEQVLGVELPSGGFIAFPAAEASDILASGEPVIFDNVEVFTEAGGLRAEVDGVEVPTHQSFWFAWSQFHPETELWSSTTIG
jgi:hypothetical protein